MQVANKKTAKEVWECLKTRFVGADRVKNARLQTLKSEFDVIHMNDNESLDHYAGRLTAMSVSYSSLGGNLSDSTLVKKLFDTVPEKFINVVAGIEQFYDLDTLTFEEAVGRLKTFEERTRKKNVSAGRKDEQVLLTQAEWEARYRKDGKESSQPKGSPAEGGNRGRGGKFRGRGRERGGRGEPPRKDAEGGRGTPRDKSHIRCYNCNEMGHYSTQCRVEKKNEEAYLTHTNVEPALLMATSEEILPDEVIMLNEGKLAPEICGAKLVETSNDIWFLDNGASNHMTGDKKKFLELDEAVTGKVRFGDDSTVQIQGKGSILFECKNGDQWLLEEVYYIPRLKSNMVSLGQLTETGHRVVMDGEELEVFAKSPSCLIMKVRRTQNRLYQIELKLGSPSSFLANLEDLAWLWHTRLGHVNFQALKSLANKRMAVGLPSISHPIQLCRTCLAAKQTRHPFAAEAKFRASKPLELLHIDLCGPITPTTPGGNRYFMLIIDDYSRWMWLHMLRTKDEACSSFRKTKQLVENATGLRIKVLRSDRGGEFLSKEFTELCEQEGIERHLTAPYSPQQNGVVERRNRTVMAMARSLLKSMNVPSKYWGEAVRHSVYLLNRLPTKAVPQKTPFEVWTGKKPHLAHLRVFGCTAHAKVTSPNLKKLDDRSQSFVYLGVEEGSKAHRLLEPHNGRIHVSRDVVFEENAAWDWDSEENDQFFEVFEEANYEPVGAQITVFENSTTGEQGAAEQFEQTASNSPQSEPPVERIDHGDDLPTPWSGGHIGSDDGPVRYRYMADILAEAPRVELDFEEVMLAEMEEPTCYNDAVGQPHWEEAMAKEIQAIEKNKTWSLVPLPVGHKAIGLKWVFKLKKNSEGQVIQHKARLVAKGYVQRQGIDFEEVFAPVARMDTVRVILALAANRGWQVHHLDFKSAFLNGDLEEDVYVTQPEGFKVKGNEHMVFKLNKALYGLRQASRAWNIKLDKSLKQMGFVRCLEEQAVYTRGSTDTKIIVGVYVDDLIVTGEDSKAIEVFKKQMMGEFEMSDLGLLSYYLGIEVDQFEGGISIKQAGYAKKVLTQFGMLDCNYTRIPMEPRARLHKDLEGQPVDVTEYRRVIGCLRYLLNTRPDLSYAIGVASRFMERPTEMHHKAVKQVLRYLRGTIYLGLVYRRGEEVKEIVGYSDSDLAGDIDDRKSTGGMAFYINDSLVSWSSQKQKTVALSSCEAEFMAAAAAACQALWLKALMIKLAGLKSKMVKLFVDNKSALALMKNPVFHGRSKHIDTKYHFIRECVEGGQIEVDFIRTDE